MINVFKSFTNLKKYEKMLWLFSLIVVGISYVLSGNGEPLALMASLIGVTALIFVAKGDVLGQVFTVLFSVLYGIVSYKCRYYGEMITYVGMSGPIALVSVVTWIRHPYSEREVKVNHLTKSAWTISAILTCVVTVAFYFILDYFETPNLLLSTVSITTSFLASTLMMLRSEYYAIAYSGNDIVLIGLWILMTMENIKYLPMIFCFCIFLINDLYGFINWSAMKKRQK